MSTINKQPKYVNITLSEEEAKFILAELGECFDTEEAEDMSNELIERLRSKLKSVVATNMWYVNYYEIKQGYGGPEEGGWWYYAERCVDSVGCSVDISSRDDVSILHEKVLGYFDEDQYDRVPSIEEIQESLNSYGEISIFDRDSMTGYGARVVVKIEQAPAQSEDVWRPHYE